MTGATAGSALSTTTARKATFSCVPSSAPFTGTALDGASPIQTRVPLFSGEVEDGDQASGTIYVLRSKSDNPWSRPTGTFCTRSA